MDRARNQGSVHRGEGQREHTWRRPTTTVYAFPTAPQPGDLVRQVYWPRREDQHGQHGAPGEAGRTDLTTEHECPWDGELGAQPRVHTARGGGLTWNQSG